MKISTRFITLVFLIMSFLACLSTNVSARRRAPKWVKERPINSEYYIGIAMVSKADVYYLQTAKNQALADLCSEISVQISSNSILSQFENKTEFKEEFQSNISTSLIENIEGYEMMGSWTHKKENKYWVYYRLKRSKYLLLKRIKLNKAKKLAQIYIEQARANEDKLQIHEALRFYAKALESVKNHLDDDLSVMTFDGPMSLGSEIYNSVHNIYKRINFSVKQKYINVGISSEYKEPIKIKASWLADSGEEMLTRLPLQIKFTKGDGLVSNSVKTNMKGIALAKLSKVSSKQKLQEITISLDLQSIMIGEEADGKLYSLFFSPESAPRETIFISVERLKAYLNFNERIFGKVSTRKIFENNFKKELSDSFFSFTDNKSTASVILNIDTNVSKGEIKEGRNYKVFIVYLDCFVSLIDNKSGNEIFNDGFQNIKGMKPISYNYAVKEAYEEALLEMKTKILPQLEKLDLE